MHGWSPREAFWWWCLRSLAQGGETGYFVTHNKEMLITTAEQDVVLLHTGHTHGEYSVASLGAGECGVYSPVSMTVREDICAKCLQSTSSLQASTSQNMGLLVASLMDGSKEGNVYRGWWPLSSLHVPRKNFSCQSSTEIYTTFCLSKKNYRKNCAFSCNCWVRRGWRWETQNCHSGPMGKQFTAWHNSFSQYLSSGSSLYGLANLSTFH